MGRLETKDAVDLLYKQTTIINGLWTTYAVAGLAAGSFAALNGEHITPDLRKWIAGALTVGFGAFTAGNLLMLRAEIRARWALAQALMEDVTGPESVAGPAYSKALALIPSTAASVGAGTLVHVSIDACVIAAIWIRALMTQS